MPGTWPSAEPASQTGLSQDMTRLGIDIDDGAAASDAQRDLVDQQPLRHFCPVRGCMDNDQTQHCGWQTAAGLRPHIDAHPLGVLPGRPSAEWMNAGNWTVCGRCGKLVSRRCAGGMHRRCHAQQVRGGAPEPAEHDGEHDVDGLPTLDEIFNKDLSTQDKLADSLLPLAE